ncbi:hypothetical protein OROMI_008495 [Orobanche minor]
MEAANKYAIALLRSLEFRLLRCTIPTDDSNPSHPIEQPSPPPYVSHLDSLLNEIVTLIESGNYVQALSCSNIIIFPDHLLKSDHYSPQVFYSETLPNSVSSFFVNNNNDDDEGAACKETASGYRALFIMAVAVAALLAFTQCNITGPRDKLQYMPFAELWIQEDEMRSGSDLSHWETWAHTHLTLVGSDLRGKFSNLQYLTFAKTLLVRLKDILFEGDLLSTDGVRSITWWLARVLFLQQRLLDECSSHLFDLLQVLKLESLSYLGTLEKIEDYWGVNEDCPTVLSMLHLELGIVELFYGRVDAFRLHFESAAQISGFNYFVSGDLGFRTVHQVEPKAQLRLVAGDNGEDHVQRIYQASTTNDSPLQESRESSEVSDVLMTPRFVSDTVHSENEQCAQTHSSSATQLKAVHQTMVLVQCSFIAKRSRVDELEKWEVAPYIEAIDSQCSSPFILRCFCNILRVRWESTRSRTKQRAVQMMENLVEEIYNASPEVAQRMYFSFAVNMPTIPALRKDFADILVSNGLVGEALKIYEDLELWDNLIYCYKLMGKKAAAVELIKIRITENPSDSRLWCLLGDITNDDSNYKKALEISAHRSSRAFRSLALSAFNRGDYEKSKQLWESALALNSMHPNGWFALGSAALKLKDVDKALDAFTRAVQLDPENGEAWNNIACLHMIKKRNNESFIAFKEALKLKRGSWQIWENFSHVAADIGNFSQAMEAVLKILDMTGGERIDCQLLERIMIEIEGRTKSDLIHADSSIKRETENLIRLLGQVLKQANKNGGNADSRGLYARWHRLNGDLLFCLKELLIQVRSYQGSNLWRDKGQFMKFARASLELCQVWQELALLGKSRKELFDAERHLKSTISQAVEFSNTGEYRDLVACLEDVQGLLKADT